MDKALQTQLANIQSRTGKSLDELVAIVRASGLEKHGQMVALLKDQLGMGHGDANTIVHLAKGTIAAPAPTQGPGGGATTAAAGAAAVNETAEADRLYTGPKAGLREIHDRLMAGIHAFGPFEVAPKKTYLSLRRKKQFATVGPATNTRVEVGLNMKGVAATGRLEALPPVGMCQYRVKVTTPAEIDPELLAWIRLAYDGS
jgi:hypothetical protein